jgi:hypothetical protein
MLLEGVRLTADGEDRGVMDIRDYESKLGACMPSFRGFLRLSIIKVYGYRVIWGCVGVSEGEEQDAP